MFIKASKEEVEALLNGLYESIRGTELRENDHPVFVLMTKDRGDRHLIERLFWNYFREKYLININYAESKSCTRFECVCGSSVVSIMLLDIASIKRDEPHQKDCGQP